MKTTFTAEEAKEKIGEVLALAFQGEPVAITRGSETLLLQKSLFAEPIPTAPPGYFDDIYDEEYVRECNEFGKHSSTTPPDDLE